MPKILRYHPRVVDQDLKRLSQPVQERIVRAITTRLVEAPERYASPLAGTLRGLWKLRIGEYRVVFTLGPEVALIVAIVHRREVYRLVARRLIG